MPTVYVCGDDITCARFRQAFIDYDKGRTDLALPRSRLPYVSGPSPIHMNTSGHKKFSSKVSGYKCSVVIFTKEQLNLAHELVLLAGFGYYLPDQLAEIAWPTLLMNSPAFFPSPLYPSQQPLDNAVQSWVPTIIAVYFNDAGPTAADVFKVFDTCFSTSEHSTTFYKDLLGTAAGKEPFCAADETYFSLVSNEIRALVSHDGPTPRNVMSGTEMDSEIGFMEQLAPCWPLLLQHISWVLIGLQHCSFLIGPTKPTSRSVQHFDPIFFQHKNAFFGKWTRIEFLGGLILLLIKSRIPALFVSPPELFAAFRVTCNAHVTSMGIPKSTRSMVGFGAFTNPEMLRCRDAGHRGNKDSGNRKFVRLVHSDHAIFRHDKMMCLDAATPTLFCVRTGSKSGMPSTISFHIMWIFFKLWQQQIKNRQTSER
ncbi:hypothetical protein B0H17DRAFT_1147863 [Mycena rosella]|uniref:Uncharacterized protein n=1 Tax=Mycena rosella TaxID=1033263 RepID=A0AAD7CH87_MYCRO|nr:hypothetical protein B0H17DRAFT_1147863 [Mycena rosella]